MTERLENNWREERLKFIVPPELIHSVVRGEPMETLSGRKLFKTLYRDSKEYPRKYALAIALIEDRRYIDVKFLLNNFVVAGNLITPEVEQMREDLSARVEDALVERKRAEEELKRFAKDLAENKTVEAQTFNKIVNCFGPSRVIDILYRSRPDFKGIPVERVAGFLSDYIGDYLLRKRPFSFGDVKTVAGYLSEPNFPEDLLEVMKNNCLDFYNSIKREFPDQDYDRIVTDFFDSLELDLKDVDSPLLAPILARARDYYKACIMQEKPPQIVNALKEGREFPDINQRINIQEIKEKRRVLIADEMGLGKSASAILAKETLGIGQALVVVPSNVISTWQRFLSDEVGEDDKQIGYFRKGMAPKVLVVEQPSDLQAPDVGTFDYIIVSHERLNGGYTENLEALDFGMLVVDEAHKLKNLLEGVRAQNLLRLSTRAEERDSYVVLMSGTPVPNKVRDVAMIIRLLYPEEFRSIDDKELLRRIINGELVDIRNLLVPRMQMKLLEESIEMPELTEEVVKFDLSEEEKAIYEVLLEDDEITAPDKIKILRQFLMNPRILGITPEISGLKIVQLREHLKRTLQDKDKVVVFVNEYVEGIIRGDGKIITDLGLTDDVEVRLIMGGVSNEERDKIQEDLNTSSKKMVVFVNGDTSDVGVDFSGAEDIVFYNEPWTRYEKRQQLARGYREGLDHPLTSATFIARGTIEEGIHIYTEAKYKAVEKLLKGIPISEIEKRMLKKDEEKEKKEEPDLEVNPELARYYFSAWHRMLRIFGHAKELGEPDFYKFVGEHGKSYADTYQELGARSYQANACRVSATVIDAMVREAGQNPADLAILDVASGPEMLKRHAPREYQEQIASLDINPHHFAGGRGRGIMGSFLALPVVPNSVDYLNLSLAFHYTRFLPTKGEYERLELLMEMNRVLKTGGRAVLNLIYNREMKDMEKFVDVLGALGFRYVEEYSDIVEAERQYRSSVVTVEKVGEPEGDLKMIVSELGGERLKGIKFGKGNLRFGNSRKILSEFDLRGRHFQVDFNSVDRQIFEEELETIREAEGLKAKYGGIKQIPSEEVATHGFVRVMMGGKRYMLFRKLKKGEGGVIIK